MKGSVTSDILNPVSQFSICLGILLSFSHFSYVAGYMLFENCHSEKSIPLTTGPVPEIVEISPDYFYLSSS